MHPRTPTELIGIAALLVISLSGCLGIPEGAVAVEGFELERYLGTWYEIARLDHRFERGLSRVQAHYSLRDDGGVRVLNRGYDAEAKEWQEAEGKAYFIEGRDVGRLKVSFFGPFYGAYNILELDQEYRYALVVGATTSYLWILSREPSLPPAVRDRLIQRAAELGFPTEELIFPVQDPVTPSSDQARLPWTSRTAGTIRLLRPPFLLSMAAQHAG